MLASVISFEVTTDESIESFTEERQSAIHARLMTEFSCFSPSCYIQVAIVAGSLNLKVIITVPTTTNDGVALSVTQSVERLLQPQNSLSRLSTLFNATVHLGSTSPAVENAVSALIPVPEAGEEPEDTKSKEFPLLMVLVAAAVAAIAIVILLVVCCWQPTICVKRANSRDTAAVPEPGTSDDANIKPNMERTYSLRI